VCESNRIVFVLFAFKMSESVDVKEHVKDVKEVRHGLFRVYWQFRETKDTPVKNEGLAFPSLLKFVEFQLCGSQSGRNFVSSVTLLFLKEFIWFDVGLRQLHSSFVTPINSGEWPPDNFLDLPKKLDENFQEPIKMWIEGDFHYSKDLQFLQKHRKHKWKTSLQVNEVGTFIVIYIDFGTSEVRQTHMICGLAEMFHSQTQCDVTFKFKGGQSIGAHIIILSAASPVFAAMFQSDFKESRTHEVVIEDIDFQVFTHFLNYLYSCRIPKLAKDGRCEQKQTINLLCQTADKYLVEDLKNECAKLLNQFDDDDSDSYCCAYYNTG
jgi:hypothetical protein